MAITFELNGKSATVDVDPTTPLLWVLRDTLNLTGTKYGCGIAACGACTVHINGIAQRSCVYPVSAASGKQITTIEGLSHNRSHAVQEAWIAEQVPQCGYCQSGQIMTAVSFKEESTSERSRCGCGHVEQYLPLWNEPANPQCRAAGRGFDDYQLSIGYRR